MELKHAAMSCIRIDDELAVGQPFCQVVGIGRWYHAVMVAIGNKYRLFDD